MQNYKISALLVRFAAENPYLYRKKREMMDRVFHARISFGQYLFLAVPTILAVYGLWNKDWIISLIFMCLLVWCIELLIHTQYTLTDDGWLIVTRGRFSRIKRIPLSDILLVEPVKAVLLGRLAVNHYVLVHYTGGKVLALQPVNEAEFVRVLEKRKRETAS